MNNIKTIFGGLLVVLAMAGCTTPCQNEQQITQMAVDIEELQRAVDTVATAINSIPKFTIEEMYEHIDKQDQIIEEIQKKLKDNPKPQKGQITNLVWRIEQLEEQQHRLDESSVAIFKQLYTLEDEIDKLKNDGVPDKDVQDHLENIDTNMGSLFKQLDLVRNEIEGLEDAITDNGMDRPTIDQGDIAEIYNQMGELEKNFREFEDGVQQEFIKLEPLSKHQITNLVWRLVADAIMYHDGEIGYPVGEYAKLLGEELNEKLEKKLKDMVEITRRLDSHDETITSMLKQLDAITDDIDKLRDAGVGTECQGLDDATDSTFGDIFKKLDEQDRKLKYLESIIQKMSNKRREKMKDYRNIKPEEMANRLLWLLKNGSIGKDEQEICELVGELRFSGYITMGAWNLFKQTMEYDQYIEQEPHLEKTLESIYSILKEDKLFEIFDNTKKTTTQP